jgi:F-type H+-transporting ATPase subunit gamma
VVAQVLPLGQLEPPPSDAPRKAPPIYEFLPSPREVLDRLLPMSVRMKFYQCFLDSLVSEQFSRMTAMRAASDNAEEMIHDLTIRYNHMRQSQITTELSEIMGGRAGIEA